MTAPVNADQKLAQFGARVLRLSHNAGGEDLDAKLVQDAAIALRVYEWVRATEPCGVGCVCARVATLPQDCLRVPDEIARAAALLTP